MANTSRPSTIAEDLWALCQAIDAAVISDALDARGLHKRVMSAGMVGITAEARICGTVRTMSSRPLEGEIDAGREYAMLIDAIDGLNPGDVLVTDQMGCCVWGELCSERALARQANGAVIDGYHRDTRRIIAGGFPVFSRGAHMSDMLYHREIIAHDQPVITGGVHVSPGDLVMADADGVVFVPADIFEEVIRNAAEKSGLEDKVREALASGQSARDVWETYKVL